MILCPNCESDYIKTSLVEAETRTDNHGNDWMYITQVCQCLECKKIWYEYHSGLEKNFYWRDTYNN